MYGSRYGAMGSVGLGGYGLGGMSGYGGGFGGGMSGYGGGLGMGYGSSMGMGMGTGAGMGYGGMGGMGNMGMSSGLAATPAVDSNGNPLPAITAGPNNNNTSNTAPLGKKQLEAQRKAQLAEQKRQRRMFLVEATMQVVSGVMQLLLQLVMGVREMAGIVIGCYYSYHMFKSFRGSISGQHGAGGSSATANGMGGGSTYYDAAGNPTAANPLVQAANGGGGGSSFARSLKTIAGAVAMYAVARGAIVAYRSARNTFAEEQRKARIREMRKERKRAAKKEEKRRLRGGEAADISDDSAYDSSSCSSCTSSDFGSDYDSMFDSLGPSEPRGRIRRGDPRLDIVPEDAEGASTGARERKIYVALHDYESNGQGGTVSFRAGDQFEIEDFNGNAWCAAIRFGDSDNRNPVLVPGTFLKPLTLQQKF